MHHRQPCDRRDCWGPPRLILSGLALLVAGLYLLYILTYVAASGKPGAGQVEAVAHDEAVKVADARSAGLLSLVAREKHAIEARLDSLERHDAESLRYAHQKRAALADELRREFARDLGVLRDIVEADRIHADDRATADGLKLSTVAEGLRKRLDALKPCGCPPTVPTTPPLPGKNPPAAVPARK